MAANWYDDVADGTADANVLYAARWNAFKDAMATGSTDEAILVADGTDGHKMKSSDTLISSLATKTLFLYIPIPAKDFKVGLAEAGYWDTDELANGIPEVRMTYTITEAHHAYATVIMPQDWDGGNLKIFPIWKTASADTNTFVLDVYAARFADGDTRDVALSTKVATMTDTNTGAGKVNQGAETADFTITGTGKTIELMFQRDYATDTLDADVMLLGVMIKCIVTKV